jgi:hypothetical protein
METVNKVVDKLRNVANGLLGVEGFAQDASGNTIIDIAELARASSMIILYSLFALAISLGFALGAARLSYCHNIYMGNDTTVAILFAILCFFFPTIYYPVYAIFLNPVCSMGRKNKGVLGGLIGGRRDHRG